MLVKLVHIPLVLLTGLTFVHAGDISKEPGEVVVTDGPIVSTNHPFAGGNVSVPHAENTILRLIPEPSSVAMLLGVGGMLLLFRRRG